MYVYEYVHVHVHMHVRVRTSVTTVSTYCDVSYVHCVHLVVCRSLLTSLVSLAEMKAAIWWRVKLKVSSSGTWHQCVGCAATKLYSNVPKQC